MWVMVRRSNKFSKEKMVVVYGRVLSESDGAMSIGQLVMRHILAISFLAICTWEDIIVK
jgi:hypothetical protein